MIQQTEAKRALIIVDVQNDFCTGGSLCVADNEQIFPVIDRLRNAEGPKKFDYVFRTRDWHPLNHASFQASNPGSQLFEKIILPDTGVEQVMWPTHCVQNTHGADWHPLCPLRPGEIVVDKGTLERVDSYSGFGSHPEDTGLLKELLAREVTEIYCVGLALDYCVGSTACDGAKNGFKTYLITDATKSVNPSTEALMLERLKAAGVILVTSD